MSKDRLKKIVLLDHQQQLSSAVPFHVFSEFEHSTSITLITQLIEIDHYYTMLTLQHRMHPHIVELVN